jgi:DNA-binding response OmpR family regulator
MGSHEEDEDEEERGRTRTASRDLEAKERSPSSASARPGGRRILVVDDDVAILEALEVLLGGRYDVLTASDGQEALRLIHERDVDLVISDVLMPLVAGEELVEAARKSGVRIPVILMSGHHERLELAREAGADAYLYKPFPFRSLEERIERLLHD